MNEQLPVNQNEIQIMEYFNAYNKVIKLRRAGKEGEIEDRGERRYYLLTV